MRIPKLFRRVSDEQALEAHLNGRLLLQSHRHFANLENNPRRDVLEGNASGQIKDGLHITDCSIDQQFHILCLSEHTGNEHFGPYLLEVNEPEVLQEKILSVLSDRHRVWLDKVEYIKTYQLDAEPDAGEYFARKYMQKPPSFSDECEWRYTVHQPF